MKLFSRRLAAVLASAVAMTMLLGNLPLTAQEAGKAQVQTRARTPGKRVMDPTRRVPSHFGQLGLSDVQKQAIYQIRAKHQPKIDALEKQIADLREQMVKECETVLTDTQKKLLEERRVGAADARARRSGGAVAGVTAKAPG